MGDSLGVFLVSQDSLGHLKSHVADLISCTAPGSPPVVVAAGIDTFDVESLRANSFTFLSGPEINRSLRFSREDDFLRFVFGALLVANFPFYVDWLFAFFAAHCDRLYG